MKFWKRCPIMLGCAVLLSGCAVLKPQLPPIGAVSGSGECASHIATAHAALAAPETVPGSNAAAYASAVHQYHGCLARIASVPPRSR